MRKKFFVFAVRGERPWLRSLLLAGILGATAWAFHAHFAQRMQSLNVPQVQDVGGVLSPAERGKVGAWRRNFRDALGMDILLRTEGAAKALTVPSFSASTIFVGVNPKRGEAVLIVPPLAKKVLGEGERVLLEETLAACVQKETVYHCVEASLQTLFAKLVGTEY